MKSKKALAFENFKFSDPGQQLATYAHRVTAEKVCRELNELKARMLATAYP